MNKKLKKMLKAGQITKAEYKVMKRGLKQPTDDRLTKRIKLFKKASMATQKRMILQEANVAAYMAVQTDDPFESREFRKKSYNLQSAGRRMGTGLTTY